MKNKKDDELIRWLNNKEDVDDRPLLGTVLLLMTLLTVVNLAVCWDVPGFLKGAMVATNVVLWILAFMDE